MNEILILTWFSTTPKLSQNVQYKVDSWHPFDFVLSKKIKFYSNVRPFYGHDLNSLCRVVIVPQSDAPEIMRMR